LELYFQSLRELGDTLSKNKKNLNFVRFFNAIASETRLIILKLLDQKDYCVCELEAILDKSQSSISHHLRTLEENGLIQGIKKGYFTHYHLIKDKIQMNFQDFYEEYHFSKFDP